MKTISYSKPMQTNKMTIRHIKSNKSNKSIVKLDEIITPSFRQPFKSTMNIIHIPAIDKNDNENDNDTSIISILDDLCNKTKENRTQSNFEYENKPNKPSRKNKLSKDGHKSNVFLNKKLQIKNKSKSSIDLIKLGTAYKTISTDDNSNTNTNSNSIMIGNNDQIEQLMKRDSLAYIQNNWAMGILETINDNGSSDELNLSKENKENNEKSFWKRIFNIGNFRCGL